MQRSEPQFTQA